MNQFVLTGHLGCDPETKYLESGKAITSFTVAEKSFKKDAKTQWWRCSTFGMNAESAANLLKKGSLVVLTGSLKLGSYTDMQGNTQKTCDLNVSSFELLGSPKEKAQASEPVFDVEDDIAF